MNSFINYLLKWHQGPVMYHVLFCKRQNNFILVEQAPHTRGMIRDIERLDGDARLISRSDEPHQLPPPLWRLVPVSGPLERGCKWKTKKDLNVKRGIAVLFARSPVADVSGFMLLWSRWRRRGSCFPLTKYCLCAHSPVHHTPPVLPKTIKNTSSWIVIIFDAVPLSRCLKYAPRH